LRAEGTKPTPQQVEQVHHGVIAARDIAATLAAIRATGATAEYLAVDVTDADAVQVALAPYRRRVTGIVHGAGVLADETVVAKRAAGIDRVLSTKIDGLTAVLDAVDGDRLTSVVLFASVAGVFGNRGQADYAMANEALNRLACSLKRGRPDMRVTAINWGAWAGGMVTPELARLFTTRGVPLIPLPTGASMFAEQFTAARGGDVLCVLGPDVPLSPRPAQRLPASGRRVIRDLASLVDDPVIADHSIGGVPVLPATVVVGAMLNISRQLFPGLLPVAVRDFAVFKGVSFADRPDHLEFLCTQDGADSIRVAVRDDRGRPRYGAKVELADRPPVPPPPVTVPDIESGEEIDVYAAGLFHGPLLQGIRRLLRYDDDGLALACEIPCHPIGNGEYTTDGYSPAFADVMLQAGDVWVGRLTHLASLPTAFGFLQSYRPLPHGRPFVIAVQPVWRKDPTFRFDVTACSPDTGEVLAVVRGVDAIASAALIDKFKAGAR
jgi:NAD(P)-dependent dehydrogenase (short-subunit alcohol dehydrogenase family)